MKNATQKNIANRFRMEAAAKWLCEINEIFFLDCWNLVGKLEKAGEKLELVFDGEEKKEMPKLMGTEKQIVWAQEIRERKLDHVEDILEIEEIGPYLKRSKKEIMKEMSTPTDAKYWIDGRDGCGCLGPVLGSINMNIILKHNPCEDGNHDTIDGWFRDEIRRVMKKNTLTEKQAKLRILYGIIIGIVE